jgi:hypothetical protein
MSYSSELRMQNRIAQLERDLEIVENKLDELIAYLGLPSAQPSEPKEDKTNG